VKIHKTIPAGRKWSAGFVSLGCAKNLVDSEIMASLAMAGEFRLAPSPEHADVVIVNTCAFIRDARRESVEAILEACELRRAGRCRAVVVAGCLPQRYRDSLMRDMPEIDAIIGLDQLPGLGRVIARLQAGERGIREVSPEARAVIEPPQGRPLFTGAPFAYVKIAEGCDHCCAFCAIPSIRGRYRSRTEDSIVRESADLLSRGIRELNLVAQDVSYYGRDLGRRDALARLLRRLGRLGGRFWVRLLYAHPDHLTPALLDAIAETDAVCKYLDVPLQHAHARALRRMARSGDAGSLRGQARLWRRRIPGLALRTTFLVGFPGETEAQFRTLLNFVRDARFDHVGVFAYSPEENTPAAGLPDRVPGRVAAARRALLLSAQRAVIDAIARARKNTEIDALVETTPYPTGGYARARSGREAPEVDGCIQIRQAPANLKAGDFIRVRITGQAGCDLTAVPA